MNYSDTDLDRLTEDILSSAKYRHISLDLVRKLGAGELRNQPNLKMAIKETRNCLHLAAAAYLNATPRYGAWTAELDAAENDEEIRTLSVGWMSSHASTRERLPILGDFYATALSSLPPVNSVIDIGCGLNPLAITWMGFAPGVRYEAYDIYRDMMQFVSAYLKALSIAGGGHVVDCVSSPPAQQADIAIILKFLPVLEQIDKRGTTEWLKRLNARNLLISFPTRTLGGRSVGMARNYEERFLKSVEDQNWALERFQFVNELVYMVHK